MEQKEVLILIVFACATFFIFCVCLIILFVMLQKRRLAYHQEIVKTRIEIKEQTLKNISWEIHDNIGQILSTLVLYNHTLENNLPGEYKPKVLESRELIENAIKEVRALSKATNTDYIKTVGLLESVKLEMERFQRLKFLKINLIISGEIYRLNEENELILLRILQEFFTNTIKHSKASKLEVIFQYEPNELKITAKDDGIGIREDKKNGTGIINMQNRAKLIGAFFNFDSGSEGTTLEITCQNKLPQYEPRKNSHR
jgi:signal transduction histidine kinase